MRATTRLHPVHADPAALAPEVRDYLEEVLQRDADRLPGLVVPAVAGAGAGKLGAGLGALALALLLLWPGLGATHGAGFAIVRGLLVGAGVVLLLLHASARRRGALPGSRVYVDALYAWNITPQRVDALPVLDAHGVRTQGRRVSWVSEHHRGQLAVRDPEPVAAYLEAMSAVLGGMDDDARATTLEARPNRIAAAARARLGAEDWADADDGRLGLPVPIARTQRAPRRSNGPLELAIVAGTVGALAGGLLLGFVGQMLKEGQLYRGVRGAAPGDTTAARRYLATFPDGRYRTDVERLLDDQAWAKAQAAAPTDVQAIDDYLRDHPRGAHRSEGERLREDRRFEQAKASPIDDDHALDAYRKEFPRGRYLSELERLDEDRAFRRLTRTPVTDVESVDAFLASHPEGRHAEEARGLGEARYYARVKSSGPTDLMWPKLYLSRYPDGLHADEVRALKDDRAWASASASEGPDTWALDVYIKGYPDGRHIEEAHRMRDGRHFQVARRIARKGRDPVPLRAFLADRDHTMFRDEAKAALEELYEEAAQAVEQHAEHVRARKDLVQGLAALLRHMPERPDATAYVAFQQTLDLDPVPGQRKKEQQLREEYGSDRIVEYGTAFDEDRTRRRAATILTLLDAALGRVVASSLLQFQRAGPGVEPQLVVHYTVRPTGELVGLVSVRDAGFGAKIRDPKSLRFVRTLRLSWDLEFRPPSGPSLHFHTVSEPTDKLTFSHHPDDDDSAAYGALLESSFLGFAARVIGAFGLPAPPVPEEVSFTD